MPRRKTTMPSFHTIKTHPNITTVLHIHIQHIFIQPLSHYHIPIYPIPSFNPTPPQTKDHNRLSMLRPLLTNTMSPILPNIIRIGQHIENILLLICRPLMKPKQHTPHKRQYRNRSIIPHQQRILRKRHKRLPERIRKRIDKMPIRRNQRSHILRRLGERKLQPCDGCEDL